LSSIASIYLIPIPIKITWGTWSTYDSPQIIDNLKVKLLQNLMNRWFK
jgi:hypothetical protein